MVLEKLLYSCPGIDKIYLLVREKQGATAQQRVQKILEQPVSAQIVLAPIYLKIEKKNPMLSFNDCTSTAL